MKELVIKLNLSFDDAFCGLDSGDYDRIKRDGWKNYIYCCEGNYCWGFRPEIPNYDDEYKFNQSDKDANDWIGIKVEIKQEYGD